MIKRFNSQGYTLVELLTVSLILVVVSTAIAGFIVFTLKGTTKSHLVNTVSQNGNAAVSIASGVIKGADNVIQINGVDVPHCVLAPTPAAYNSVTLLGSDGGQTELACTTAPDGTRTIASNSASLIDTSRTRVSSCQIKCIQQNDDPYAVPLIELNFTIEEKPDGSAPSTVQIPFNTRVQMRNYTR